MTTKDISDYDVCKAYAMARAINDPGSYTMSTVGRVSPITYLQDWTGQSKEVCEKACKRAYTHGVIFYGLRFDIGWVTPKGEKLMHRVARDDTKRDGYATMYGITA